MSLLIVNFLFGFGDVAAVEEDVYTNRLRPGSLAAELRIPLSPARTGGITLFGLASKDTTVAMWMMPATPWFVSNRLEFLCLNSVVLTLHSFIESAFLFHTFHNYKFDIAGAMLFLQGCLDDLSFIQGSRCASYFVPSLEKFACDV